MNLLHKTWMIGGENLMYVVHSVYFVSSPKLHAANTQNARRASTLCVRFFLRLAIFYFACSCFALVVARHPPPRCCCRCRLKECALCAYLHFAFGQRICFLPLTELVLSLALALALFFVVTVECSRLKLTPKYHHANCLFVCLRVFVRLCSAQTHIHH